MNSACARHKAQYRCASSAVTGGALHPAPGAGPYVLAATPPVASSVNYFGRELDTSTRGSAPSSVCARRQYIAISRPVAVWSGSVLVAVAVAARVTRRWAVNGAVAAEAEELVDEL